MSAKQASTKTKAARRAARAAGAIRMRKEAPSLERVLPRHPLDIRDQLVQHENGCLLDPSHPGLAYCPRCWLPMHESYFPMHDRSECELVQMEEVHEVMEQ